MDRLVSHIEFLLHHHNCVIIPDFGGFVVNAIHSREEERGGILPPACELVFNRNLTYNDGLMAQSYMKTYQLTFDSATLEIQKGVRDLKHRLYDHHKIELGPLGSFTMHEDKRIVYAPASFTRPSFFGLSNTTLKPLAINGEVDPISKVVPLNPETSHESRTKKLRIASISAAAVAVIAIMLLLFPVSDSTVGRHSARILSETEWFRIKPSTIQHPAEVADEPRLETITEETVPTSSITNELVVPAPAMVEEGLNEVLEEVSLPKYYIIMGVFSGTMTAQKMTDELSENGFTNTGWLERPGRIDVYVASFTDEMAARVYLKEIHVQYPAYSDAWILKR